MEMNFEAYCNTKKIDHQKFSKSEPTLFVDLKDQFEQMSVESFTQQKLFLINPIRRKYPIISETMNSDMTKETAKPKVAFKPVFKPKL